MYIGYNTDYHNDGFQNTTEHNFIDWDVLTDGLNNLKIKERKQEYILLERFQEHEVIPDIVRMLKKAQLDVLVYNLDYIWDCKNGKVCLKKLRNTEVL